jgi:hypothetical protein
MAAAAIKTLVANSCRGLKEESPKICRTPHGGTTAARARAFAISTISETDDFSVFDAALLLSLALGSKTEPTERFRTDSIAITLSQVLVIVPLYL